MHGWFGLMIPHNVRGMPPCYPRTAARSQQTQFRRIFLISKTRYPVERFVLAVLA